MPDQPSTAAERDPADYGPVDDLGAEPATAVCRECGHVAVEHTRGRYSIYGVCPVPGSAASGFSRYGRTLAEMYPDTWADVYCPDGQFHRYRKRFLRHRVCVLCSHRRSF